MISLMLLKVSMKTKSPTSYLFSTFLKIGTTAFGGFMALISVVRDQVVNRDKMVEDNSLMDGITLAAILPGPMAVNVVSFVGYKLDGYRGALVAMTAVIIPSFLLILLLSMAYFEAGDLPIVNHLFAGITPAVAALILTVALSLYRKHVELVSQRIIILIAGLGLFFIGGFAATLAILFLSGLAGYILYRHQFGFEKNKIGIGIWDYLKIITPISLAAIIVFTLPFLQPYLDGSSVGQLINISAIFGGLSLTLFGGGYVMVPVMHELFVSNLEWLSSQEFSDGIALGQVTPGPILITAAFIGYKMSGFLGAIVATVSIFLPPGLLMIAMAGLIDLFKNSGPVKAVFRGLRPAIIGLIMAAAVVLAQGMNQNWKSYLIMTTALIAVLKYEMKLVYLIPVSGIAGLLLYSC